MLGFRARFRQSIVVYFVLQKSHVGVILFVVTVADGAVYVISLRTLYGIT